MASCSAIQPPRPAFGVCSGSSISSAPDSLGVGVMSDEIEGDGDDERRGDAMDDEEVGKR
jgi:hypothetical protein